MIHTVNRGSRQKTQRAKKVRLPVL